MPGILLLLERTKILLARHRVAGVDERWEKWWGITIKRKGRTGKEGRAYGEGFMCKILLLAKGEHTSQEFFSLIKILTG